MFSRAIRMPFTLAGIPVLLDWSFLIILVFLGWSIGRNAAVLGAFYHLPHAAALPTHGWAAFGLGLIAAIGLFIGVVLHELGHALTARAYGVRVRSITLWFLGGVARFEDLPRHHAAEAVIAVVGPMVSFVLGALCWAALYVTPTDAPRTQFVFAYLATMNVMLGLFNLIPALPLDGGRILRSLLSLALPFGRATQVAGWVSRILAILIGIFGLLTGNFFLLAVAVFVFFAVVSETSTVRVEELLRDLPVTRLMNTQIAAIPPETRVGELSDWFWRERRTMFPVVDREGRVLGSVSLADAQGHDPQMPVNEVMHQIPVVQDTAESPDVFRALMQSDEGHVAVINANGQLVGIVSKSDLIRAMQLREFGRDAMWDRNGTRSSNLPLPRH